MRNAASSAVVQAGKRLPGCLRLPRHAQLPQQRCVIPGIAPQLSVVPCAGPCCCKLLRSWLGAGLSARGMLAVAMAMV